MEQYDRVDADLYDLYSTGTAGDVEFYLEEARKAGSPTLEIGCGTGRILIPLAEARLEVTGLDRAPAMLAVARDKIARLDADVQGRIRLVEADMRDFRLEQQFRLVMMPYRVFVHALTPEDQRRTLLCIREHLGHGGRLVFNVFDPNLDLIVAHRQMLGSALTRQGQFVHPDTGHTVVYWGTRQFDPQDQTVEEYFIFEELDPQGRVLSKRYVPFKGRFTYRWEMQYLLELCGYRVEALYGDFCRGPFQYGREQIWIARMA